MQLGNQYADNKIYRGIKHYDSMPLTSGDLHEYADTEAMKRAYLMNNLLGYGMINTPSLQVTDSGINLIDPAVVMIDGDISLIQTDAGKSILSNNDISSQFDLTNKSVFEGVLCILGWYQHISYSTTMRNYGGVDNAELPNDLYNEKFKTVISTRYQFRWFPICLEQSNYLGDSVTIDITDRDSNGTKLSSISTLTSTKKRDKVIIFDKPTSMDYSESDLYLIPILFFNYNVDTGTISEPTVSDKLRSNTPTFVQESEPTGVLPDGTMWYNPLTREFKFYIKESGGFVESATKMAFLQYQSLYVVTEAATSPQDIVIPIGISEFQEGDVLRVTYENLLLSPEDNYTVDYENKTITLLGFTTNVGDKIHFNNTKIVEADDITNVTKTFVSHMATSGTDSISAHVKLSDIIDNKLDRTKGTAATPKAVHALVDSTKKTLETTMKSLINKVDDITDTQGILIDDTTKVFYKLGIDNGLFYIEEV